jgi:hypothetical protein
MHKSLALRKCLPTTLRVAHFSTSVRLSLDEFFSSSIPGYTLPDQRALEYMKMAAELSLISRFRDEAEMLQYKNDFQAALLFIKKLEEVSIPQDTEPLCNVLEFYGGNEEKMRRSSDYQEEGVVDIQREIKKMNRNMQGNLVKTPKPFDRS